MKTSLGPTPPKRKGEHLLITDAEPICIKRVSQQIMIIIIIAWRVCFMQQKQWRSLRSSIIKAQHLASSKPLCSGWTWIIISEKWNAGVNTWQCLSSPLYGLSLFRRSPGRAPATDQRPTLIHSEWSRRRDKGLCDYGALTYQFQSFQKYAAVTHKVHYALCLITRDPVLLIMKVICEFFMRKETFCDKNCCWLKSTDYLERAGLEKWKRHALSLSLSFTAALVSKE